MIISKVKKIEEAVAVAEVAEAASEEVTEVASEEAIETTTEVEVKAEVEEEARDSNSTRKLSQPCEEL
jgi:hypothetical protein